MLETILTVSGVLGGILTTAFASYLKIKSLKFDHDLQMTKLANEKDIALASAQERADDAENEAQNQAFEKMRQILEDRKAQMDKMATQIDVLQKEHRECHTNLGILKDDLHKKDFMLQDLANKIARLEERLPK